MRWYEIEGCLTEIMDITGCTRDEAVKIYYLVADWSGGNTPDRREE